MTQGTVKTEMPERITAWPDHPKAVTGSWSANTYYDERPVGYVREDLPAPKGFQTRSNQPVASAPVGPPPKPSKKPTPGISTAEEMQAVIRTLEATQSQLCEALGSSIETIAKMGEKFSELGDRHRRLSEEHIALMRRFWKLKNALQRVEFENGRRAGQDA